MAKEKREKNEGQRLVAGGKKDILRERAAGEDGGGLLVSREIKS